MKPTRSTLECQLGIRTSPGPLTTVVNTAKKTLDEGWLRGEKRSLKFSYPRVWLEPTGHSTNCYFCVVDVSKRRKGKNAAPVNYPDISSSIAPIPYCSKYSVPVPPGPDEVQDDNSDEMEQMEAEDMDYQPKVPEKTPHFPNQKVVNDLIRDMGLTKSNAELFISRMKQWHLVKEEVRVTSQRSRHEPFSDFYTLRDGLCFCHDVPGLFDAIGVPFVPKEWRLFIDSSSTSLKAVLSHNGNKFPTLPLAHSVTLKEYYYSVKVLLEALKYDEHKWEIIGDFKMVAFLLGLQAGFIKFQCFLCLWGSRATSEHYRRKNWEQRTEFVVGSRNVMWEPLVDPRNVLMPPLHIKLGLMKQFVKALNQKSDAFNYLLEFFPKLSEAKIKSGIFVGPQIKKIFKLTEFSDKLSKTERTAWNCFKAVVQGFLGNYRAENYQQLVQDLIKAFNAMGCRMSLKLHMLDAHLEKFKDNVGD